MKTKAMKAMMVLLMTVMFYVPVAASVPNDRTETELNSLRMEAHKYGLSVTNGNWIQANGVKWRKVYVAQANTHLQILLQWDDYDKMWFTISTKTKHMSIPEVIKYLRTIMKPTIVKTSLNFRDFGFRVEGVTSRDRVIVYQIRPNGQTVTKVQAIAHNGWWWYSRNNRASRAIVKIICQNGKVLTRSFSFWKIAAS